MLTAPIAITVGAQAYSLKLKNNDNFTTTYMDNTTVSGTEVKLTIRHAYEGKAKDVKSGSGYVSVQMERHIADLEVTVFDANGYGTTTQSFIHLRNRRGQAVGFSGDVMQALCAFATTNADNLAAWEG